MRKTLSLYWIINKGANCFLPHAKQAGNPHNHFKTATTKGVDIYFDGMKISACDTRVWSYEVLLMFLWQQKATLKVSGGSHSQANVLLVQPQNFHTNVSRPSPITFHGRTLSKLSTSGHLCARMRHESQRRWEQPPPRGEKWSECSTDHLQGAEVFADPKRETVPTQPTSPSLWVTH